MHIHGIDVLLIRQACLDGDEAQASGQGGTDGGAHLRVPYVDRVQAEEFQSASVAVLAAAKAA